MTEAEYLTEDHWWLHLEGAANVRAVVPGALIRADNLQSLTPADIRTLVNDQGVELVIDLRTDVEVRMEGPGPLAATPGVHIANWSLYPTSDQPATLDESTVAPWRRIDDTDWPQESRSVRRYMTYLARRPDSIVGSIEAIARADGAVIVHCAAGKDRTGLVVAFALDAAGVDRPVIVRDYVASGDRIHEIIGRLSLSPTYRDALEGRDPRTFAPEASTIQRVLDLTDQFFGGPGAWLMTHGLDGADLERLRRRLNPSAELPADTDG
jgi:protein tyrosine/serine phosphatase